MAKVGSAGSEASWSTATPPAECWTPKAEWRHRSPWHDRACWPEASPRSCITACSQGSSREAYQQAMFKTSIAIFSKSECGTPAMTPRSAYRSRGASVEVSARDSAPYGLDGQAKREPRSHSVSRLPTSAPFAQGEVPASAAVPTAGTDTWTPRKTGNGKPIKRGEFISTHFEGSSLAPPKLGLAVDTDASVQSKAPSVPQSPASQQPQTPRSQLAGGVPLTPRSQGQSSVGASRSTSALMTSPRHRKIMELKSNGHYRNLPDYSLDKGCLESTGTKTIHPMGVSTIRQHAMIAEEGPSASSAKDLTTTLFSAQEPLSLSLADADTSGVPAAGMPTPRGTATPATPRPKPAPLAYAAAADVEGGASRGGAGSTCGSSSPADDASTSVSRTRQSATKPAGLARLLHAAQHDAAERKDRRGSAGTSVPETIACTSHMPEYVVPERRRDALCPTYTPRGKGLEKKMEQRTTSMHPQFTPRQLPKTQQQALKSFTPVARVSQKTK